MDHQIRGQPEMECELSLGQHNRKIIDESRKFQNSHFSALLPSTQADSAENLCTSLTKEDAWEERVSPRQTGLARDLSRHSAITIPQTHSTRVPNSLTVKIGKHQCFTTVKY